MFLQASFWFRRTTTTTTTAAAARTKKSSKTVRFSGVDTIQYTHSSAEYDRSSFTDKRRQLQQLFEVPPPYSSQFNATAAHNNNNNNATTIKKQQKPPMLRIDTQVAPGGPLFLTHMSTNYGRPCGHLDDSLVNLNTNAATLPLFWTERMGRCGFYLFVFSPFLHHVPYRATCIYIIYNNAPKQHSLKIHYTLVYYAQEGPRKMTCHAGKEGGRGFFRVYIYNVARSFCWKTRRGGTGFGGGKIKGQSQE